MYYYFLNFIKLNYIWTFNALKECPWACEKCLDEKNCLSCKGNSIYNNRLSIDNFCMCKEGFFEKYLENCQRNFYKKNFYYLILKF